MGIGCALGIFKVIQYETGWDEHQANYDDIYRIVGEDKYPDRVDKSQGTPHPLGPALRADYPELLKVVRVHYAYGDQINITNAQGVIEKHLIEDGLVSTENDFFEVFTVEWLAGNQATALLEPNTAVISTSIAQQFYGLIPGSENQALGKLIDVNGKADFKVVGVVKDPVETTNFPFTIFLDYHTALSALNPYYDGGTNWNSTSSNTNTYVFLPAVEQGIVQFLRCLLRNTCQQNLSTVH
jgi:hypothetical protein